MVGYVTRNPLAPVAAGVELLRHPAAAREQECGSRHRDRRRSEVTHPWRCAGGRGRSGLGLPARESFQLDTVGVVHEPVEDRVAIVGELARWP